MTGPTTSEGRAVLRPEIAQSWHRAQLSGVDAESAGRLTVVEVDRVSRLAVAAAPVLQDLAELTGDQSLCLLLADRDCRIIFQGGDRRLRSVLESGGVGVGTGMGEDAAGTNALGTALELGRSVWINGAEHYLHALKSFSCFGRPVRHPLTRRVEGVLDITATGTSGNPLFAALIARAARDIEARLLDGAREVDRRLFRAFHQATRQRSAPIAVLGGDTVLTNQSCLERLGSADPSVLNALASEVRRGAGVAGELDLGPAGIIATRAELIDGTPDGVLLQLGPLRPPSGSRARRITATSPTEHDVLVSGEPGTGRSTEARRIAGTASTAHLDAAEALRSSERAWAGTLFEVAHGGAAAVVIDDVDLLPATLCSIVGRVMSAAGAPRFVLTSTPADELAPHVGRLVARCSRHVELSPLRERPHDMHLLVAELVRRAGAAHDLVLTPAALQALGAHPWPGNLVELANVVQDLTGLPSVSRIDVGDLPERYRPTARVPGHGGRERAERVAILHALGASGGNKLRAAEELGISRTTLYRRMRALAVPADGAVHA